MIGNPPYGATLNDEEKKIVKRFYKTTQKIEGVQVLRSVAVSNHARYDGDDKVHKFVDHKLVNF